MKQQRIHFYRCARCGTVKADKSMTTEEEHAGVIKMKCPCWPNGLADNGMLETEHHRITVESMGVLLIHVPN